MSNRIIINDAPDHIKDWYKNEASNYGRGLSPYILHVLCDLAYANGCPKPKAEETKAEVEIETRVESNKTKPIYNNVGDVIGYE